MMLFILATEYNEHGWREAANDGVLTNLTAWEYSGQKKQFSGAIYKTVGGAGAVCLMTILMERDEEQADQIWGKYHRSGNIHFLCRCPRLIFHSNIK